MLTLAYYLLKITICSGILYGYYLLALRNKIFHKWNRFYLLAIIIISLVVPLVKINIWQTSGPGNTQVIQLLQVVNSGDEFVNDYANNGSKFHLSVAYISIIAYIMISLIIGLILIRTLIVIRKLKRTHSSNRIEGINFITTNTKGTPFSFFNNIFWNDKIDINTPTGRNIFQHEIAHIREGHSYDKLILNFILIFT